VSVFVDDGKYPYGRLLMCHMIADTSEELLAMARRIGVAENWIQKAGTAMEHFDICQTKRALAIQCGAIGITTRELSKKVMRRRAA
jgi:hypothetical protein